jgi:membrane fusion protein, multidrug efflux system
VKKSWCRPHRPSSEVLEVQQKDVPVTREWVGTLTGKVNAQIRAQFAGYLMQQLYTNGAYVKKGTPPFQFDPRSLKAGVDQAAFWSRPKAI